MASRDEILALLRSGHSYETAARELGIPAGRVYLLATGLPADASDGVNGGHDGAPLLPSAQALVGPPAFNPTRKPFVQSWVRERARRELARPIGS